MRFLAKRRRTPIPFPTSLRHDLAMTGAPAGLHDEIDSLSSKAQFEALAGSICRMDQAHIRRR